MITLDDHVPKVKVWAYFGYLNQIGALLYLNMPTIVLDVLKKLADNELARTLICMNIATYDPLPI